MNHSVKLFVLSALALIALSAHSISAAEPVSVTIDANQKAEAVSPYIYGQFIEHLGRCIYGGIWAEMLEDRKFYFPVTPQYDPYVSSRAMGEQPRVPVVGRSPWQIIGDDESVSMVREDSFVGEHTPRVNATSGIRQNDLALIAGKEYVGYVWLQAVDGSAAATVTLRGAAGECAAENVPGNYTKYPLKFTAQATTDSASLEIRIRKGACFVGTASLMPADHIDGMRPDTLKLLAELNAPMYRWPGGNFVSGYDWRDGVGDRDRRPPRKNPAWTGVEHNDFGLDEFIAFCRKLEAEPLIAVNTGFGDAYSAAQEVEYANGAADTVGGKWRADGGHAQPYHVTWWCVGNEMFGPWQLGFMQLKHYTQKHNEVSQAMLAVDNTIKLIGVGDLGRVNREHDPSERRGWSKGMMQQCADTMNLISEHFYCGGKDDLAEHVRQIPDLIRQKAEGHRRLREELDVLKDKDIRIAMDEWNYWHRPYEYGELGCIYRLRDALGIAAGLHEYYRNTDIINMAHYAQTVNVIGCIKTTKTAAAFATTGLPLKLYRQYFGVVPVATHVDGPLDVMAALSEDSRQLTIGIVNSTMEPATVALKLTGRSMTGEGQRWQIAGDDPMAFNEPGVEPQVVIVQQPVRGITNQLEVAPCSVTLYSMDLK